MVIYQVWDHDPMASSMGADYIARTFFSKADAEAEVKQRNDAWRKDFESTAQNGKARAVREPWNWRHARLTEATVD